jgi:putative endopeptidase
MRTHDSKTPLPGLLGLLALISTAGPAIGAQPTLPREKDPLVQYADPSVKPGDDFFRFATGSWLKNNPIPPSERAWGVAYVVIEEVRKQLRGICETAATSNPAKGTNDQKVGDFWLTAMDSTAAEAQGLAPIRPELDRIDAISNRADLMRTIAYLQMIGVGALYSNWIAQDDKNSEAYVTFLMQGGLGLPDRDYYFLDDSTTTEIRKEYPRHIARMFTLMGKDDAYAERAASAIVDLETKLAGASRTIEQLRDPYANYNKMSVNELVRKSPALLWREQLEIMNFPKIDSVVVGQPEFYARADSLVDTIPLDAWKDYLRWNLVTTFASNLSSAFDKQNFHFYGTVISGTPEQRPRWKRAVASEENSIGELLGQVWVRKYCSPATKARYEKLTDNIFATYRDRIQNLTWMTPETKSKAIEKLDRVTKKVAYPDKWRDFSSLSIERDSYARNKMRVNEWWFRYYVNKLGRPVDRTEWDMTPQTYNAYYNGSNVEIVLPAAVFLIPGAPDSLLDDAILYAYAGASTIGHEITHGFDDQGRQYDAHGNMRPWWTPADSVNFMDRAQGLVKQYDDYVINGKHVRGFATLGENIADLGGLAIAYDAFTKTDQYKKGEPINGLSPDERFFRAYALSWMQAERPEALAEQIMTDVHSPSFLRINGPLADTPEFYKTFGVKPGDAMYRPEKDRVKIW